MDSPPQYDVRRAHSRLAAIREDISSRLWHVTEGMSRIAFGELMDQMALLQFNFEQRAKDEYLAIDRRMGQSDRRLPGGQPFDEDVRSSE